MAYETPTAGIKGSQTQEGGKEHKISARHLLEHQKIREEMIEEGTKDLSAQRENDRRKNTHIYSQRGKRVGEELDQVMRGGGEKAKRKWTPGGRPC